MSDTARPIAALLTLGCKVNQYESEAIAEALSAAGVEIVPPDRVADIYIINTCTVTAESDRKSRQMVRRCSERNPAAYVLVTGCSAEAHPETFAAIPGVDCVVGNRRKLAVVDHALALLAGGTKPAAPLVDVPPLEGSEFEPMSITRFGRARAYVKIEDGCESRCAYCAIPAARGPIRSKPMADVLAEVTALSENGCREIVLTGIETGSWGRDLGDGRLGDLLAAVDEIPGVGRIRLGSLDPTTMTEAFAARLAGLRSPAPHFHLSMQSGCSATLARMRRKYNAAQAMAAMERIRAVMPDVQFTTDMIVGFPGETEEEFAETLNFARRARFLHIHVFPYSRREGTPAATLPDRIPEEVKRERVKRLSQVSEESCAAILDEVLTRPETPLVVLPETRGAGFYTAHTPHFLEVRVESACPLGARETLVLPVRREGEVLICRPAVD